MKQQSAKMKLLTIRVSPVIVRLIKQYRSKQSIKTTKKATKTLLIMVQGVNLYTFFLIISMFVR